MSRYAKEAKRLSEEQKLQPDNIIKNFMGGDSYKLSPILQLKLVTASSILGEPSYYNKDKKWLKSQEYHKSDIIGDASILTSYEGLNRTTLMEHVIDEALDYDFDATVEWAVDLREEYFMRLNPQIIMVRAAIHPKRAEWSEQHNGKFAELESRVMKRADEPMTQLAYFIYINKGKKNKIPSILKRAIAKKLGSFSKYQINKYKNAEIGMINAVRLVHAYSPALNELMKTGKINIPNETETWEQKRSAGMPWAEIIESTDMGHMAMLRNIKNVFNDVNDRDVFNTYMDKLVGGVLTGKQFPYRYHSAYKIILSTPINFQANALDKLAECMDVSVNNLPHLKGKTICLSDNSGSAWGQVTTEYGSETVAEIDNLSSVIAARCSDEGYVGKFGDTLKIIPVSTRNSILGQAQDISRNHYADVGPRTENGIWIFFRDAIKNKTVYDNIFIFSDQQAGTGGLYGTPDDAVEYYHSGFGIRTPSAPHFMINVFKLIEEYRKKVNRKVNVFSVQTAGYNDAIIPEMAYRTAILTGWTGKEVQFAKAYIDIWDEAENIKSKNNNKKISSNEN